MTDEDITNALILAALSIGVHAVGWIYSVVTLVVCFLYFRLKRWIIDTRRQPPTSDLRRD